MVIEVSGLAFAYPSGVQLFADVDLAVAAGSTMCITGPSGVGKSTLLYCLAGVLKANGEIVIDGERLGNAPAQRAHLRLRKCGFVFQRGELLPELSVVENVALPLRLVGGKRQESMRMARVALEEFGIDECADRTPDEISGGQAQRASVARALITSPTVIFADEPTSSLDSYNRSIIVGALRRAASSGTAVICATHDMELIAVADTELAL